MTDWKRWTRPALFAMLTLTAGTMPRVEAGWSVGVSIGAPIHHRHCYPHFHSCRPYPLYVSPAPVIYRPVTVIERPVTVVEPVPAYRVVPQAVPAPEPTLPAPSPGAGRNEDVERYQRQMFSPEPRERAEALMQLGRLRAPGARDTLTAAMHNDRSPLVRETAARALGLFGSADTLDALQRAAQTDEDQGVRQSASYSAEVIRANLTRR